MSLLGVAGWALGHLGLQYQLQFSGHDLEAAPPCTPSCTSVSPEAKKKVENYMPWLHPSNCPPPLWCLWSPLSL